MRAKTLGTATSLSIMATRGMLDYLSETPMRWEDKEVGWDLAEHASFQHHLAHDRHVSISSLSSADLAEDVKVLQEVDRNMSMFKEERRLVKL